MAVSGIANTPLINYFCYKQSTVVSGNADSICYPITAIADAGNGQLLITATGTDTLTVGVAVTFDATTGYDGNYTVISVTSTTFNVSGIFTATSTGTWELSSNITGANAGDPLDFGKIFFYDNDNQTTPLDTYSDRDLTILNTNPLILDAVGSAPPIYLLDQPYYIEIFDKFNNLVATLENYLPDDGGDTPGSEGAIENLFPNYGIDSQINNGDYENESLPIGRNPISSGWIWEIQTTLTIPNNTYRFIELANSSIIGSPKNEVILKSTNNSSGDTLKTFLTTLGNYSDFQNKQLAISIFIRSLSGVISNIPVQLRRTKNGVNETPIPVGTIPVSATRTQQIISFTVPALTTSSYLNEDVLELLFILPVNTDFEVGFTAMWCQVSADGTVSIEESAFSLQTSKEVFALFPALQEVPLANELGLPLQLNKFANADTLKTTGTIFIGKGDNYSHAIDMASFPGDTLVLNQPEGSGSTNRIINYLRTNNITQSRSTFIAAKVASLAEFTITTGIGSAQLTPSSATAGGRVTLTKTTNEFAYAVSAKILFLNGLRHVDLTFVDQFAPGQAPHVFSYDGPEFGTLVAFAIPPIPSPMVSWMGVAEFSSSGTGRFAPYLVNEGLHFRPATLNMGIISAGSGSTNAEVRIKFSDESSITTARAHSTMSDTNYPALLEAVIPITLSNYHNGAQDLRVFTAATTDDGTLQDLNTNYLGYNDISSNPATQADPPPHVIRFSIDGAPGEQSPSGTMTTLVVALETGDTGNIIARKLSNSINTSWIETGVIVMTPENGDYLFISNPTDDFVIIYFDTTLSKPGNPAPARHPIFVEFTPTTSLEDIAQATADAVNASMAVVPYYPDLGLPPLETGTYYMTT